MSPLPPNPYEVLGVAKDAQIPEIRSAHRKLVLKCHPDKVQDPQLKAQKQDEFQKVQQAYELLSDDKERQKYDDKVKLAELTKQFQKANVSSPRATPKYAEYEIRTAEPRPSTFSRPGPTPMPPGVKIYSQQSRSFDEDYGRGPRIVETEIRTSSSSSRREREPVYVDRPSKREMEREREHRDVREREKERDRERRRRIEEDARREEKLAKEARRADKKAREKQRDKDIKRATEEKRRTKVAYTEAYDDELPKDKKKSSSSKKYDEKRDRSSHRDEIHEMPPPPIPPMPHSIPPMPQMSQPIPQDRTAHQFESAASYIKRSKQVPPVLQRSATSYHARHINMAPPAPTPPPAQGSPYAPPPDDSEEDVRRSSARRRESSETVRSARSHKKSREFTEEPTIIDASPSTRHTATFQKATTTTPLASASPPRRDLPRTNSMPVDHGYTRPASGPTRASTFSSYGESPTHNRGRSRSRMQPQIEEEEDSESEYEREQRRRERDRKHRSSKKTRSPEPPHHRGAENVMRYSVNPENRSKLQGSYSRHLDEGYYYHADERPAPAPRGVSYSSSPNGQNYPKVKTSRAYGYDDVQYSSHGYGHGQPMYHEEYSAAAYA